MVTHNQEIVNGDEKACYYHAEGRRIVSDEKIGGYNDEN